MKTLRFAAELIGWFVSFLWLMAKLGIGNFVLIYQ